MGGLARSCLAPRPYELRIYFVTAYDTSTRLFLFPVCVSALQLNLYKLTYKFDP